MDQKQRLPGPDQDPRFFSELVHIPPGGDRAFLSYLRACRIPEWEDMLEEGALQDVSVYELEQAEGKLSFMLKSLEDKLSGIDRALANPPPDMLPPKVYENKVTIYPVSGGQ